MKYWNADQTITRDVIEGEGMFDVNNPSPAVTGEKLLATGETRLYEVEAVPNSERLGTIISPITFEDIAGVLVDVEYRYWDDDTNGWSNEQKMTTLLLALGFDMVLPKSNKVSINPNFDYAMQIL